jgi:glucoamylase
MGRYADDKYYSGGAYYFSTLGAAQFHYRLANAVAAGAQIALTPENRPILAELSNEKPETLGAAALEGRHRARLSQALIDRGDMFMATVRRYTPDSGELSEQFSQVDGAQTSAKKLTWSYAAFITAVSSRRAALAALTAR